MGWAYHTPPPPYLPGLIFFHHDGMYARNRPLLLCVLCGAIRASLLILSSIFGPLCTSTYTRGRILSRNWDKSLKSFPPYYSQSPPPPPPLSKSGLKLVCNVNIVYGYLKSEKSQYYAQKPQRNCTFMNFASGHYGAQCSVHFPYISIFPSPVEVRSTAGNFDTLGKNFVSGFWRAKSKFRFWHLIDPDFIRTVNFFTRESPARNIERKNIFRETPVEVRSFDGTVCTLWSGRHLCLLTYL